MVRKVLVQDPDAVGLQQSFVDETTVVTILQKATVLTDAQVKALPTTPVELVPAPGAGKMNLFIRGVITASCPDGDYTNVNAAAVGRVRAGAAASQSNDVPLGDGNFFDAGFGTVPFMGFLTPMMALTVGPAIVESVGFTLSVQVDQPLNFAVENPAGVSDGDFTGGGAGNSITITVWYGIVDL